MRILAASLLLLLLAPPARAEDCYADYAAVLKACVRGKGVDYDRLRKDRAKLDRFVASLENALPGKTKKERLAFWINAYNALTLQRVLDTYKGEEDYSVKTVRGFWKSQNWTVAKRRVSLDEIEHEILRPLALSREGSEDFIRPKIHFAINCASVSCPPLLARPYRAKDLSKTLEAQARAYLADTEQNRFDLKKRRAEVSRIFDWFGKDFTLVYKHATDALTRYLADLAPTPELERSLEDDEWTIRFRKYDWRLNRAGIPAEKRGGPPWSWWHLTLLLPLLGLLFGIHAIYLVMAKRREGRKYLEANRDAASRSTLGRTEFPRILVQLPVYNEPAVVARAIRALAALDYPRDRMRLQILDDSTDETSTLIDKEIPRLRREGVEVEVLRRGSRSGFKAGALAAGLERSSAEYVAVFDADFVPPADFLCKALPLFSARQKTACVQGRWEHLNRNQNRLTRAQALLVDAHFRVQHLGRAASGKFLNFNGTAGIWRTEAIRDAGGWSADTLTEDLDLSYRAQLKGWTIVYDPDLVAPAELPPTLSAFKSQQMRWACGTTQCARKHLRGIWRHDLPLSVKLVATAHLCGYGACLLMLAITFAIPFGFGIPADAAQLGIVGPISWAAWLGVVGPLLMILEGQRERGHVALRDVLACYLLVLGSAANNGIAVLRGLSRPVRVFVRTPKFGLAPQSGTGLRPSLPLLEFWMMLFTAVATAALWQRDPWITLPYALFCLLGFACWSAYWGLVEARGRWRGRSS